MGGEVRNFFRGYVERRSLYWGRARQVPRPIKKVKFRIFPSPTLPIQRKRAQNFPQFHWFSTYFLHNSSYFPHFFIYSTYFFIFPTYSFIFPIYFFMFPAYSLIFFSFLRIATYSLYKQEENVIIFQIHRVYRKRDLGIFLCPRAYIEGWSSKFFQVPRTFSRM